MFFTPVIENGNTRETVNMWTGLNHNYNLTDGQFFDMENMSSDCFPYLTPRGKRHAVNVIPETAVTMIRTAEGFAYISSDPLDLVYTIGGEEKRIDLFPYFTEFDDDLHSYVDMESLNKQKILKMGTVLLILPRGLIINMQTGSVETQGAKDYLGEYHDPEEWETPIRKAIGFSYVDMEGKEFEIGPNYQVGETTPDKALDGTKLKEGDHWFNTQSKTLMVYDKDSESWMPVTTTYIRIAEYEYVEDYWDEDGTYHPEEYIFFEPEEGGLKSKFSVGDAVYMDTIYPEINNGSILQAVGAKSLVIIGTLDSGTSIYFPGEEVNIERRVPKMDFTCVSANRLWGCRYGENAVGEFVNEIFCSKQGDPKNFFVYDGLANDSYAVSLGDDGPFTGCIEYQGMPTFFKENMIYKIYGQFPANYQVVAINARGVQKGSDKSLAICNEYLLYKSPTDVVIFDGNRPTGISMPLGRSAMYYNAVAGWNMGRYYITMKQKRKTEDGTIVMDPTMYVYDMDYACWYKEDQIDIKEFLYNGDGKLYGYLGEGSLLRIGTEDPEEDSLEEPDVEFWAETGDMGYEYPDHKYLDRLTVRAFVDRDAHLKIEISYDGKPWEEVGIMRQSDDTKTNTFVFRPMRCDHFRLRFSGVGNVRVYTLSRTMDTGSEEHPWTR